MPYLSMENSTRKTTIRLPLCLGTMIVIIVLTACGMQKSQPPTLRVGLGGWMLSQFPVLRELSEHFSEEYKLLIKFYKYGAAPPPYIMQFRRGRCDEDVILASRFDRFAAARIHALENLSQNLPPGTLGRLIEPAAREAQRTGSFVELPYLGEVIVLNYNRRLLAEAGISEPARSWEELEKQAAIIKTKLPRITPLALVLNADSQVYFYYPMLLGLAGTCEDSQGWPLTKGDATRTALQKLQDWSTAKYCNSVGSDAFSLFRSGDAAYFISWASHGAMASSSLGDDMVGFVPLPGPAYISFHRGAVPKASRLPNEASQFLNDVLLSPAMQSAIYACGKVGVLKADYDSGQLPPWVATIRRQLEHGSIGPSAPYNLEKMELAIHQAVQGVSMGQLSPDQAMKEMTAARMANEALAQRLSHTSP